MNKKNITLMVMLGFFISSFEPCYSMSYMRNSYYAVSTRVHNFVNKCREVGILATFYALMGVYSFKRITGLDEKKLDEYTPEELRAALDRIEIMARPSKYADTDEVPREQLSKKLEEFYIKVNYKLEEALYKEALYHNRVAAPARERTAPRTLARNSRCVDDMADYVENTADRAAHHTKHFVDTAKDRTKDYARDARRYAEDVADRVEDNVEYAKDRAHDYADDIKVRARRATDQVEDKMHQAQENTKEFVENAKVYGKDLAERTKDRVSDFVENAKETASDLAIKTKDKAQQAAAKTKEKASEISSAAKDKAYEVKEKAKAKTEELKERAHDKAVNSRAKTNEDIERAAAEKEYAATRAKGHGLIAAAETYDAGTEIGHHAKETAKDLATALKEKTKEAAGKVKRTVTDAVEYMTENDGN